MSSPSIIKLDIGMFKGFSESGLEFTAEIVSPYHTEYRPNIGEFIGVMLNPEHAILGRITRFIPMGVLSSWEGDEYLAEMRRRDRQIPEDLKETRLRYTVSVRLLGGVELRNGEFIYHPSIRQLPHLGAAVGTLSDGAIRYVCALGKGEKHSVPIGFYSLGETVFEGSDGTKIPVVLDLDHLIARRTYVFARAGYGKSNLIKLLTARLYQLEQPGGMIIFDPEGEYPFRDKRGRPGLADVPYLGEKLVVYTNRKVSAPYDRWVAGNVKLDLRHLRPADVVNQCVAQGKQENVFANVLRGLDAGEWQAIVDLIKGDGYRADEQQIATLTGLSLPRDAVVIGAIKNNLTPVVGALHSSDSDLVRSVGTHLATGRIVVIDISLLSSVNGYRVAGLILNELFTRNQENFVAGSEGEVIPIIAVLEEAQSILPRGVSDSSPFVVWVKEGRKYLLGAILVTQQPGSIAPEFLSQGDNFFAFHLLSAEDLKSLKEHNAHYSDDILASVLNEAIKGNAYVWSAPDQPFVLPARIHNFETWADELAQKTGAAAVETPVEIRRREQPLRRDSLDRLMKDALARKPNIALHAVAKVDGSNVADTVAVSVWNLMFQLGDLIAEDEKVFIEFGHTLPDGKKHLRREACIESLRRLDLLAGIGVDADGKEFILLKGKGVGRTPKPSGLELAKKVSG